ncbi:LPS export ABC transporter periplasmic protein LptC [Phenylobacterium sp.]|uniref:LPS export ABC transporter periplasmic protein LptC n=1 Tax=Phenylobacterium sp. TaxID=1871053 RepID=UPI00272F11F7|nr:LPS export ABC transporter periplasmic protein LptC [Phenylobacterium sp.]MDP1873561.1 LPS export ABC transporter periplasmic protein LptC [Phenylobacterium sp.]MDP3299338.1 LPS export ABC transporter periplasmic protein LptC [Phenylobacterium sp.]MDP3490746.1 LPS export ABC transporter periplasmic protein LptC [Phenylobacterium sp.]
MSALAYEARGPASALAMDRWRRRSRLIRRLRVVLPAIIAVIVIGLAGVVTYNSLAGAPAEPEEADAPIRLVNPRFMGRDEQGRSFVITANSAVRDEDDYQRVVLDRPAMVIDGEGLSPMRLSAQSGVFHEGDGVLRLQGDVSLNDQDAAFDTGSAVFDTATGVLEGEGLITGAGPLGEIRAKSYGVYDNGERMVFKGGVSGTITPNSPR